MPSRRVSTVIAYAYCTQKPLLPLVRKFTSLGALVSVGAARLYVNCGPDSQVASAFTLPNSVRWPAELLAASFFRADVRYAGGSCRSGFRAAVRARPGTACSCAWLGSTTTLATEYDWLAMESLVEYTIRSGSASHLPGAVTWMAG